MYIQRQKLHLGGGGGGGVHPCTLSLYLPLKSQFGICEIEYFVAWMRHLSLNVSVKILKKVFPIKNGHVIREKNCPMCWDKLKKKKRGKVHCKECNAKIKPTLPQVSRSLAHFRLCCNFCSGGFHL